MEDVVIITDGDSSDIEANCHHGSKVITHH